MLHLRCRRQQQASSFHNQPLVLFGDFDPIRVDLSRTAEAPVTLEPAAMTSDAPVGQVAERAGIAVTVNSVSDAANINDFMTPAEGFAYIVVDVSIQNVSREDGAPYNPLYFRVRDADGYEYSATLAAPNPALSGGEADELPAGETVRGNVAFEVRAGATGLVLSYQPLVLLSDFQPIRINLGR